MRSSSKAYSTLFMLNMPHLRRTGFMIRFYSQKNCFRDLHTYFFVQQKSKDIHTCMWSFMTLLWCTRKYVSSYYLPQNNKHLRLVLIFLLFSLFYSFAVNQNKSHCTLFYTIAKLCACYSKKNSLVIPCNKFKFFYFISF